MKIILSECISERLFFELLAKMSSYKIDRVFVYHKGNRTHDKRNTFPPPLWFAGKWTKRIKQNISSYLMAQKFELQLIFTIDEHTLSKKSNVMR